MKTYSTDLRERLLAACHGGGATRRQIAARFSVSVSWIRDLLKRRREAGAIAPRPRGGGRAPALDEAPTPRRGSARRSGPTTTPRWRSWPGPPALPAAPRPCTGRRSAWASRAGKSRRAAEQDRPELKAERDAWRAESAAIDPAKLVFVDESGASTAMDRTHGRAPGGVRVDGPVPHGRWRVATLTAAVRLGEVPEGACLAFDGATDAACFGAYVGGCLVPALRPGDIVVRDNPPCHETDEGARLIRSAGAEVRYLPAYGPDLSPIERPLSKLKSSLGRAKARTIPGPIEAMGEALRATRPGDIAGRFAHSGYRPHASTASIKEKWL